MKNSKSNFFIFLTLLINNRHSQTIYEKYKEKKVGVAGLQPTLISLDYSKLLN